jgi:hypothetical protein
LAIQFLLFFSMWKAFFPLIAFILRGIIYLDPSFLPFRNTSGDCGDQWTICITYSLVSCCWALPHRDRDYCIGSKFWKFYLIRTSFILGEPVSLVFRLFRLEWIFLVFKSLDTVGRFYNILCIGRASVFAMPRVPNASSNAFNRLIYSQAPPHVFPTFLMVVSNKIMILAILWPLSGYI